MYFSPFDAQDPIPLDSQVLKIYYLHLIKDGLDIDTLQLEFHATMDDCDKKNSPT